MNYLPLTLDLPESYKLQFPQLTLNCLTKLTVYDQPTSDLGSHHDTI